MKKLLLIIGIALIVASIIINSSIASKKKLIDEATDFEEIEASGEKTFLFIDSIVKKGTEFYIVNKDGLLYVAANNNILDKKLSKTDEIDYLKIYGTSEIISSSQKDLLTQDYTDEEIEESEVFENLFGSYYLNTEDVIDIRDHTNAISDIARFLLEGGLALCVLSIILFIVKRY